MLHAPKTIIATKNDGWETTFILGSSVGVQIASPKPTACRWWWWWWFQGLLQFLNWNSRDIIQIWRTYLANGCDKTRKNTYYTLENSCLDLGTLPTRNKQNRHIWNHAFPGLDLDLGTLADLSDSMGAASSMPPLEPGTVLVTNLPPVGRPNGPVTRVLLTGRPSKLW